MITTNNSQAKSRSESYLWVFYILFTFSAVFVLRETFDEEIRWHFQVNLHDSLESNEIKKTLIKQQKEEEEQLDSLKCKVSKSIAARYALTDNLSYSRYNEKERRVTNEIRHQH